MIPRVWFSQGRLDEVGKARHQIPKKILTVKHHILAAHQHGIQIIQHKSLAVGSKHDSCMTEDLVLFKKPET